MALLQHPNVIQIHEIGYSGDRPFIAMEYVGGGSLAASLAGRPMSPEQAAALVAVLADAVQRRASARRDPSRPQAGQHPPHRGRHAEDRRFRPGQAACRAEPTTETTQIWARPATWPPSRPAAAGCVGTGRRRVCAGGDPLRVAHRAAPLPGRESPGHAAPGATTQEPIPPRRWQPQGPPRPGDHLPEVPGEGAATPLRQRPGAVPTTWQQFSVGKAISARPAGPPDRAWRWARRPLRAAAFSRRPSPVAAGRGGHRRFLQPPAGRGAGPHGRRAPPGAEDRGTLDQTLTRAVAQRWTAICARWRPAADHGRGPGEVVGLE